MSLTFIIAVETETPSEVTINPFRILYTSFDGSTTDFDSYNQTELQNLANVILEKSSFGKVAFNENLDLISIAGGDNLVDFDTDLQISDNLITIDNINLTDINKSATLSLYGLSFTDPEIHHNGVLCGDCTIVSYVGGNLIFTTPSFSGVYYAREKALPPVCGNGVCESGETSSSCPADCTSGGGGGGGGGGTTPSDDNDTTDIPKGINFKVEPELFSVEMKKGTYYQQKLNVTNNGLREISIGIFVLSIDEFVFPETNIITLKPGESQNVRLDIYISENRFSDVYVGKIIFQSSGLKREVGAILNIKERDALFDIKTEVLKKYINPGGRIRANISLINLGSLRNFDVQLEYKIIDFDKNEYTVKKEDFAINQTYSNTFYLDVPEDIPLGNYLFYSKVSYEEGNVSASSFDTFTTEKISYLAWIILIIIIIVIMYLIIRWYRKKKYSISEEFRKKTSGKREREKEVGIVRKELPKEVPKLPEEI